MFKKMGMMVALVMGGWGLLSWGGLSSYVGTAVGNIRAHLKQQVPLEFEIQRVQHEADDLVPEMNKNCQAVAEQRVEVEELQKEIATFQVNLHQRKDNLQT